MLSGALITPRTTTRLSVMASARSPRYQWKYHVVNNSRRKKAG